MLNGAGIGRSGNRSHWRAMVKPFADTPGAALFFHFALKVAPRHVQPDRIAIDVRHCLAGGNIAPTRSDRNHQLDLMMEVLRQARIRDLARCTLGNNNERIGGLQEEKGRFAPGKAHLLRVFFIVTADTINAVDREQGRFTVHRDGDDGRSSKEVVHKNRSSEVDVVGEQ